MEGISSNSMTDSSELWALLNLDVRGNGRNKFDAAQKLDGLDVCVAALLRLLRPRLLRDGWRCTRSSTALRSASTLAR